MTLFALAALAGAACEVNPPGDNQTVQPNGAKSFINFETIPTRPLALSPDGTRLFATNVPDGRLEILRVTAQGLTPEASVSVGLEPIAVNARTNNEVWVVNHVSDSVSVIDVTPGQVPRVRRTLLVGDEPRDVVFAGTGNTRAFVTAARRGQNHPVDTANLTQREGEPRADVWVFDANNLGTTVRGTPLQIIPLFSDKPGSMGVTPDGSQVIVSVFTSGNGTTVASNGVICGTNGMIGRTSTQNSVEAPSGNCFLPTNDPSSPRPAAVGAPNRNTNGNAVPGGTVRPNSNFAGGANPRTAEILKNTVKSTVRDQNVWADAAGRNWGVVVPFTLPDNDVFAINANTLAITRTYQTVGTLNFDVAVHPTTGQIYVATIDAINLNRFISLPGMNLGPNMPAAGTGVFKPNLPVSADPITGRTLRGHLYESRIAILGANNTSVVSRHLNKHINYEQFPVPAGVNARSVANPQSLAFNRSGDTLFVGALGSNQIVPFSTAGLNNDSFVPDASTHITLGGRGGPAGIQLDAVDQNRMFVYKRFDNAVSVVNIAAKTETQTVAFFNAEPAAITAGRPFFYDARVTSDNGEANCNVCHPSSDKDDLAWNLGAPFLPRGTSNPNPFVAGIALGIGGDNNPPMIPDPTKGPMTVLTLRGIKDSGPMFWRGDITTPTPFNERADFQGIAVVFDALNGKTGGIPAAQFGMLTDWVLSIVPPPNPHRALNQQLNPSQLMGQGVFTNVGAGARGTTDVIFVCNSCHVLNETNGNFGTAGTQSTEGETQFFKVTQLRTTYDKVGMFGATLGFADARALGGARGNNVGPQVRGTGTLHDGSVAGAEEFLTNDVFQLTAAQLQQVVDFTYAFPSNLAPIVGQQVTLGVGSNGADTLARLDLLQQRANTAFVTPDSGPTECDLIGKGVLANVQRGYLFQPAQNNFLDDRGATITVAALRAQAQVAGQQITFTCVNPAGGRRLGIDRNLDGRLDGM